MAIGEGITVRVGLGVGEAVTETDGSIVGVAEGVGVGEAEMSIVGVKDGEGVGEGEGEGVREGVGEGVGNGETCVGVGSGEGESKSPPWAAVEPANRIRVTRKARTSTAFSTLCSTQSSCKCPSSLMDRLCPKAMECTAWQAGVVGPRPLLRKRNYDDLCFEPYRSCNVVCVE